MFTNAENLNVNIQGKLLCSEYSIVNSSYLSFGSLSVCGEFVLLECSCHKLSKSCSVIKLMYRNGPKYCSKSVPEKCTNPN